MLSENSRDYNGREEEKKRRHGSRKNKKEKKLTTPIILRPSLRNSSEIGRLPREVNNKNTYEDGDYLMVSLVDGEGTAVVVHVQNQNEYNWLRLGVKN